MLAEKNLCTGCGSCAAICPHNCIEMVQDREGFRQPVINESKCVGCGLCARVCPVLQEVHCGAGPEAYAVRNRDAEIRNGSSSGGVFTSLARMILAQGGAVCAAAYDEKFRVVHTIARRAEEIPAMTGAKYAQSRAEHCFPVLRKLLRQGVPVLFVGTPCQTAGLRAYLGEKPSHLLLVDLICHGVPSPRVWEAYLDARKKADAAQNIAWINLRSKCTGWSRYAYSVEIGYENGQLYTQPQNRDPYMLGFVRNLYLRDSCAQCRFKGSSRESDLTLGDFWGIWDLMPEFDDNRGISLLLVHSGEGRRAWEAIRAETDAADVRTEDALRSNPSALVSSIPYPGRGEFFAALDRGEEVISAIERILMPPAQKPSVLRRLANRLRPGGRK